MKITLISPYPKLWSFGIRTISAYLKRQSHKVNIIFLPRHFAERYDGKILNEVVELLEGTDLIGISLMTNTFDNSVQITQHLKENSDIPILWGGTHPTIRPEECLNHADMVCIGEGEGASVELLNKMEAGQYYNDIQGIWFKDREKIITNKLRPLIQDLDDMPFPDYDYTTHFLLNDGCIQKMNMKLLERYLGTTYETMTTRGCPFECTYCFNNALRKMYPNQKPVRKRSTDNIIAELLQVTKQLPFIKSITFVDDDFFSRSVKEIEAFCEEYKRSVGLPFHITGVTPSSVKEARLSPLVDAGLKVIRMGIQTGSERMKILYKRSHTNQQVQMAARIINELNGKIKEPRYDIMLDNPWETEEDLIETLMFLSTLPVPYKLSLFSLTFYPGTELYRKAKGEGIITDDLNDVYRKYLHSCNKTYLNRLFFLLKEYASNGFGIPPKLMSLLTNRKIRRLRLHWFLFFVLKIIIVPVKTLNRLAHGFEKHIRARFAHSS